MTLKENFENIENLGRYSTEYGTSAWSTQVLDEQSSECVRIADDYATSFLKWCNDNFLLHGNGLYYPRTSSKYFDVTKYASKEKATVYYTESELLSVYKKEL